MCYFTNMYVCVYMYVYMCIKRSEINVSDNFSKHTYGISYYSLLYDTAGPGRHFPEPEGHKF